MPSDDFVFNAKSQAEKLTFKRFAAAAAAVRLPHRKTARLKKGNLAAKNFPLSKS